MKRNPNYPEAVYLAWEQNLEEAAWKFNERSEYIRVELLTKNGVADAYNKDYQRDIELVPFAIGLAAVYIILMLGACSPIHCRILVGLSGVACIGLAYAAGCSTMFALGG